MTESILVTSNKSGVIVDNLLKGGVLSRSLILPAVMLSLLHQASQIAARILCLTLKHSTRRSYRKAL